MPYKPKTFRPADAPTKRQAQKLYDRRRGLVSERGPYQKSWWRKKRREIAIRDEYRCQMCGCDVGLKPKDFVYDHKEPRVVGSAVDFEGQDSDSNLWTLCVTCDAKKRGRGG